MRSYGSLLTDWLPTTSILIKIVRISSSQFKCNYLKNKKHFLDFLFHSWNLHQILNILKQMMIVIANAFPKLMTAKILVRPPSKECRFRTHIDSKHVKESQILARPPWQHFGHVFSTFSCNSVWKWSPLVLGGISGLLVHILTTYDKYPVQDSENFQLPIQMQLSEKRKTFSEFVVPSLESTSNFKHFERKDIGYS